MNIRRFVTLETVGAAMVTVLVIVAVFAPILAPHDPTIVVSPTFGDPGAPSRAFLMGTDELGRDVLSRIIFGARISLTVGVAAMAVTMPIGIAIGLCSGFFGGAVDFILMRFTDLMLSLPPLLLAMALVANVLPIIVVMAALRTSDTLLLDASLSFLGLGVPPPTPSWGRMIEEATIYFRTAPWLATFPGLAIFWAVLSFNLLGYGFLRRRSQSP